MPGQRQSVNYLGNMPAFNLVVEYGNGATEGYRNISATVHEIILDGTNRLRIKR
jgi:hypothetical protein